MIEHELKILPEYFKAVNCRIKKFEVRKNDRGFQVGDVVLLREWKDGKYTGSQLKVKIIYMLTDIDGIEDGYCVFGIERVC